jgi:hypothetical protein
MDYRGEQLNLQKNQIFFSSAQPEHKADLSFPSDFQVRIREAITPLPDTFS